MAGTIIIDEIKSGSSGPPAVKNATGAVIGEFCRSRAYIDTVSGAAAAVSSFNVSSVTDNGVGDVTENFISAMPSTNYTFGAVHRYNSGASFQIVLELGTATRTVNAHRICNRDPGNSAYVDAWISTARFGG